MYIQNKKAIINSVLYVIINKITYNLVKVHKFKERHELVFDG